MTSRIRIAQPPASAAHTISELALRSKGYWGYDAEFLEACRAELTYSQDDCISGDMLAAYVDQHLAGFSVVRGTGPTGELAALFVDPASIGSGVGGVLLAHAIDVARCRGITRLVLDADPGAEPFYAHHGARTIGRNPSGSIPGRTLPRMEFAL